MSVPLFITCLPDLESVLADEVHALGYTSRLGGSGVWVPVSSFRDVMRLNLMLRTATRVLLPLVDIENPTKQRIYGTLSHFDLDPFLASMPTFCVDVPFAKHREFPNTHYVAQLVKDAICDRLVSRYQKRPSIDTKQPQVRFSLIIMPNKATLYFDTSCEPLFKRGYRQEAGPAPIKENFAAALLMLAGYSSDKVLVDPCCGSATFLVEAALMATKTPPGIFRKSFGFFKHPDFSLSAWETLCQEEMSQRVPQQVALYGIERDERSYMQAKKAVTTAGVDVSIFLDSFQQCSLPQQPTMMICNPPYGVRLESDKDLGPLYMDLGVFMQRLAPDSVGGVLSGSIDLLHRIGRTPKKTLPFSHGGLDCFFSIFKSS